MKKNEENFSNVPEYYADSLGVMLSPIVSKINVISSAKNPETQEIVKTLKAQIVVPTISLLRICAKILKDVKQSEDIMEGLENYKTHLFEMLEEINIVQEKGE